MKFYTSDLHFDHKNIIKYEGRPFADVDEMNATLIRNWNERVGKKDEVYILGDFAFCKGTRANELFDSLNGIKYLIVGNHDSFLSDKQFERYNRLKWVSDYAVIRDEGYRLVLFHYPIAVWDRKQHGSIHLYGHIHNNEKSTHPLNMTLENAFHVGVDTNGYMPKTLRELIKVYERG